MDRQARSGKYKGSWTLKTTRRILETSLVHIIAVPRLGATMTPITILHVYEEQLQNIMKPYTKPGRLVVVKFLFTKYLLTCCGGCLLSYLGHLHRVWLLVMSRMFLICM